MNAVDKYDNPRLEDLGAGGKTDRPDNNANQNERPNNSDGPAHDSPFYDAPTMAIKNDADSRLTLFDEAMRGANEIVSIMHDDFVVQHRSIYTGGA